MKNMQFILLMSVLCPILFALLALSHPENKKFYHILSAVTFIGIPIIGFIVLIVKNKRS
jgi:uncharacterized membrane protein